MRLLFARPASTALCGTREIETPPRAAHVTIFSQTRPFGCENSPSSWYKLISFPAICNFSRTRGASPFNVTRNLLDLPTKTTFSDLANFSAFVRQFLSLSMGRLYTSTTTEDPRSVVWNRTS